MSNDLEKALCRNAFLNEALQRETREHAFNRARLSSLVESIQSALALTKVTHGDREIATVLETALRHAYETDGTQRAWAAATGRHAILTGLLNDAPKPGKT